MPLLLEVNRVWKVFSSGFINHRKLVAVRDVSLTLPGDPARTVALAGESGSGKTTLAQMILGFQAPTQGQVLIHGRDVHGKQREGSSPAGRDRAGHNRKEHFRMVQAVFQNPYEAFNPFYPVNHIFDLTIRHFGLAGSRAEATERMTEALQAVHLNPEETLGRFPHQLSGGQLQRLMVARALLMRPSLIIADEPVSMVDVSLRAMILDLLVDLKNAYGISIVYITHDLSTALQISDDILVMYQGSLMETGAAAAVIQQPAHPYTRLLVRSIPLPDPEQKWQDTLGVDGEVVPSGPASGEAGTLPGCSFYPRCPSRMEICRAEVPPLFPVEGGRQAACFLYK